MKIKRGLFRLLTLPYLIQINHQPDATIFQFIILTFIYSSTCFGCFPAQHQELDCSGSLWFYLRIVVTAVLCSWSGRYNRGCVGAWMDDGMDGRMDGWMDG
jgi:hypothetical protein